MNVLFVLGCGKVFLLIIATHVLWLLTTCCLNACLIMNESGIFALRVMVDQAGEGLCHQRETYYFGVFNIEKIACSDLS